MASPKTPPASTSRTHRPRPSGRPNQIAAATKNDPPEVVDPIWLVKAVGLTVVAALVCGYLTLCLLFYQGQWQLVLHPSRSKPAPVSLGGASFKTIHFAVDETASPQLTGWLIPAEPAARYAAYTLLYLPGGDGSLADALTTLSALHETGINVFAFDYRGYGQSARTRPNQQRMTEDAASAWQYLTVSRAVPGSRIVLFGSGVGCALAAGLAAEHPEAPALILQSPRPNVIRAVLADSRTKYLPVRALFHERFDVAATLSILKTPKLLLLSNAKDDWGATAGEVESLASDAAAPKMVSTLRNSDFGGPLFQDQIIRFLDQYLRQDSPYPEYHGRTEK